MFSEDELHQARSIPVLEIAERHGAKLKEQGRELVGPCPVCGGREDKFAVWPDKNIWNCRGLGAGGGAIDLEMHLSGNSFVEAMKTLIGDDAGTPTRRQLTPEEIKAREAREAERKRDEDKESNAAKIVTCLQPIADTQGEAYLRDVRRIDVAHWAIKPVLEEVRAIGWVERIRFWQDNPSKPGYELNGQWLSAIVAILTDPISGERTGGITRTFIHQGRKVCRAMSLGGAGKLGVIRLTPDEEVETGLHGCEGIESALSAMMMGFCPMWAFGSTTTMAAFPVLAGIECLTIVADNDIVDAAAREAGQKAARAVCQRWADAGREAVMKRSKTPGEDANDIIKRRARDG